MSVAHLEIEINRLKAELIEKTETEKARKLESKGTNSRVNRLTNKLYLKSVISKGQEVKHRWNLYKKKLRFYKKLRIFKMTSNVSLLNLSKRLKFRPTKKKQEILEQMK